MRGIGGRPGWSWLFALEGLVTGLIGIASYFYLPPSPYQTGSKLRRTAWLTEHEEKIMANRILRDDPGKGDMHNRQGIIPLAKSLVVSLTYANLLGLLLIGLAWGAFKASITDYHMWPIYLIGLSWNMPTVPSQGYLTLTLRDIGFSVFETSLLCVPASVLFMMGLFVSRTKLPFDARCVWIDNLTISSGPSSLNGLTKDFFLLLLANSG
jgi:hypothetical protein